MISCSDAVKQLWEYLDGTVGEANRRAIEEHLDVCKRCCGEAEFAGELRGFLTTHRSDDVPPETRDRLATFMDQL